MEWGANSSAPDAWSLGAPAFCNAGHSSPGYQDVIAYACDDCNMQQEYKGQCHCFLNRGALGSRAGYLISSA
jgi:hypothetical protein